MRWICILRPAASRIAARHVRERIGPDKPFVMAGYSNGGALTVKYNLDALSDSDLPPADKILLFSPEIGITPFSAIANLHKLFSFIPYFAQSKWLSIQPEYDPFKYNSFPKNAGQQTYEITAALQQQVQEAKKTGKLANFPPVTTFLSWVDSTVETSMTIDRFYAQLENQGNELVIFDVDRSDLLTPVYPPGDAAKIEDLETRDGVRQREYGNRPIPGCLRRFYKHWRQIRAQLFSQRPDGEFRCGAYAPRRPGPWCARPTVGICWSEFLAHTTGVSRRGAERLETNSK
jgi:hypothetical protein